MHKTKLIALLLAVAMIASIAIPSVAAATAGTSAEDLSTAAFTPPNPTTVKCPCATCNNTIPKKGWTAWTGTETHGHYYLTEDTTLTSAVSIGRNKLVLNLNGKDVICGQYSAGLESRKNFYLQSDDGSLDIIDSAAYYDGSNYVAGAIRDGKQDGTGNQAQRGGNILSWGNTTVNIHSGKVTGGTAATYGGNIYMYKGTLNVYGGEISGGTAKTRGMQIMGGSKATINIYGGTIAESGITTESGAVLEALAKEGGVLNIYGGTVGKIRVSTQVTMSVFGGKLGVINNYNGTCTVKLYNGVVAEAPAEGYLADCACYQAAEDGTFVIWNYKNNCSCSYKTALTSYAQYITVMEGAHTPDQSGAGCTYCKYNASEDQSNAGQESEPTTGQENEPTTGQEGETNGQPNDETNGEPSTNQENKSNGGGIWIILLVVGVVIALAAFVIVKVLKNKAQNKENQ